MKERTEGLIKGPSGLTWSRRTGLRAHTGDVRFKLTNDVKLAINDFLDFSFSAEKRIKAPVLLRLLVAGFGPLVLYRRPHSGPESLFRPGSCRWFGASPLSGAF